MSLSSENMMKLMAYADGELDGADLEEAHKLLATDVDASRFVEQIAGLGQLVSLGYEARSAKTVAKFDIADAVMALSSPAPAQETKQEKKPAAVSSLAAAREKRGNGLKIGAGIAAALALAASIFVFAQHRTEETPMAKAPIVSPPVPVPYPNTGLASNSGAGNGVEVSTVESAGNSVSVFYLPSANELTTSVVVWVDETGEK